MVNIKIMGDDMERRMFVRKLAGLVLAMPILSACIEPASTEVTRASERRNIETNFISTLTRCYLVAPATRELVAGAVGVLVFPTVSLVNPVTAEWAGVGVLREGITFTDYFFLSITKDGMPPQYVSRSIIFLFRTLDALNQFRRSKPWRADSRNSDVLTLVLQGNSLMTNPTMPELVVAPLDA